MHQDPSNNSSSESPSVTPISDQRIAGLIEDAQHRVQITVPEIRKAIGMALDDAVARLGRGSVEVQDFLTVPVAVLVCDERAWIFKPQVAKHNSNSERDKNPYAISLQASDVEQVFGLELPEERLFGSPEDRERASRNERANRDMSPSYIVAALADQLCKRLASKAVTQLQKMETGQLSGEDSGLQSAWDEICVQVQGEQSIFWDLYEETAGQVLASPVNELSAPERRAIWLQTPEGSDWDREDEDDRDSAPVCDGDIIRYVVVEYVLAEADRWTNARIRAYMDRFNDRD